MIETVHAAREARPGDAPDLWTCAVAERSAWRPEHRRERWPRGAEAPCGVAGQQPGVSEPLASWRDVSRGGRSSKLWRVQKIPRKRTSGRSAGAPTAGNGTPPAAALDGGERVEGLAQRLLRTAMVIFGTIGGPSKLTETTASGGAKARPEARAFCASAPDRSLRLPIEDRRTDGRLARR